MPLCAVLLLHATPEQMGMLVALQAVPFALFGLPVGVLLDRRSKLPIMLFSESMSGIALASVALAYWCGVLSMPWLYVVGFLIGTGFVVGGSAEQVFLTFLVGREGLIDAQAKFATTDSASRLVGPGIAGLLVQLLSAPVAILVTACGYLVSILNLRRMSVRDPRPPPSNRHPLREIKDGLVFVWNHPLLRPLAWGVGAWHLLFYASAALTILFATRVLGMTPGMLGMAQMLGGAGIFASSLLVKPLTRRYGTGPTILIGLVATTLGFMLTPAIPAALFGSRTNSAIAYAVLIFFFDCGVMLFFIPYMGLRQKVTPDAFLGRMTSTMRFLTVATAPLGALAAGFIAEHFGVRSGMACVAAGSVALTLGMIFGSPLRSVRT
ncbi:major Facilitator Superfamily protein [Janthinobacterium agaricidamnosum NBRC 102515 = DSM 9628]|uniref:Major Facilitator Superfamily protein n=1 Tax=Janthinobacterium agaricidamnosum NBRC 102515 = DSM 9628 TaxID=1349767 RepID=W0VD37_9BURK|nr:major Facilitator Superfamily protein [Janthinobacterium agaricidamnosum NBRC 102515 = DSM 9628]